MVASRAELDLPANREIGKISLRFDLSVKISFTSKLTPVYIPAHHLGCTGKFQLKKIDIS